MPSFLPVWMMPGSMKVLLSRMVLATAGVFIRISSASTRPWPSCAGDKLLGDDAAQRFADHDADLVALIDREDVQHAVEGAGGIGGVERADDQVAGLRSGNGELDGLEVAHFADHDDIGVFTERAAQRRAEGVGVGVDLALGDVAALGLEDVLDGVLERDDVVVPGAVDLLDQRGQRGGLARADGAGDEDEAVVVLGEELELLGQAELVHGADLGVDDAEDEVDAQPVPDNAGAVTASLIGVGEIDVAPLFELLLLHLGEERPHQALGVGRR